MEVRGKMQSMDPVAGAPTLGSLINGGVEVNAPQPKAPSVPVLRFGDMPMVGGNVPYGARLESRFGGGPLDQDAVYYNDLYERKRQNHRDIEAGFYASRAPGETPLFLPGFQASRMPGTSPSLIGTPQAVSPSQMPAPMTNEQKWAIAVLRQHAMDGRGAPPTPQVQMATAILRGIR